MTSGGNSAHEALLHNAVLAGDENAWRTLYDENFDQLYRYVRWRCGGTQSSTEDVVQETWTTAVRRIRVFDPARATFVGWLRGIASNILRNQYRRQSTGAAQNGHGVNGHKSEAVTDQSIQNRERADRIAAALASLPENYEFVLQAKYVDQMTIAEIAEARSATPKSIESLLTRARLAFQRAYGPDE